ncbi:MAG: hypothetical protein ACJ8FY_04185 [Gemmataceae bacterium]
MRPENIPELANYPTIRAFVQQHHGMQFADVRAMLRLPTGEGENRIDNGCNFAAAATLCNLISGISVVFFNRQGRLPGPRPRPKDRGRRFTALLMGNYYPWQPGEDRAAKTDVLYCVARNPIAHSLGVLEPGNVPVSCDKTAEGLSQAQVNALDVAYESGNVLPPALELAGGLWHLNVAYFYAATVQLFRALVADGHQMQQTEACFARGELMD